MPPESFDRAFTVDENIFENLLGTKLIEIQVVHPSLSAEEGLALLKRAVRQRNENPENNLASSLPFVAPCNCTYDQEVDLNACKNILKEVRTEEVDVVKVKPDFWARELRSRYIDTLEKTVIVVRDLDYLREVLYPIVDKVRFDTQLIGTSIGNPNHLCYLTPSMLEVLKVYFEDVDLQSHSASLDEGAEYYVTHPSLLMHRVAEGTTPYSFRSDNYYHTAQRLMISEFFKASSRRWTKENLTPLADRVMLADVVIDFDRYDFLRPSNSLVFSLTT